MPLPIPDQQDVTGKLQGYSRGRLTGLDPTVTTRRGFIGPLIKSLSSALRDWYVTLKRFADYEPWPQSATENFLVNGWWVPITRLTRNPAAPAAGKLVVTGLSGSVVPEGTQFTGARGVYLVDSSQSIVSQGLLISSLIRVGSRVIAETVAETHNLATGLQVTISGADQADYNGTYPITVTGENEFTYDIGDLTPTTPATGSITASGVWGNIDVTCTETGPNGNIDAGTGIALAASLTGVDPTAIVTFGGIGGGTTIEDLEDYRARVIEALGTDFGAFSAAEIKIIAKQIPGVTRVWVHEAELYEGSPLEVYEGQVKIAFVRDGDANIFPSAQEVARVKQHIIDTMLPAHTAEDDVMVISPTRREIDFAFTALVPDTASMRSAIRASLDVFFSEGVDFATDIEEDAYRCAVRDAWDFERRQGVKSFTLSEPTSTIDIGSTELPVLGTITWPS